MSRHHPVPHDSIASNFLTVPDGISLLSLLFTLKKVKSPQHVGRLKTSFGEGTVSFYSENYGRSTSHGRSGLYEGTVELDGVKTKAVINCNTQGSFCDVHVLDDLPVEQITYHSASWHSLQPKVIVHMYVHRGDEQIEILGTIIEKDNIHKTFLVSTKTKMIPGDSGGRVLVKIRDQFYEAGIIQSLASSSILASENIIRVSHFSCLLTKASFFGEKDLVKPDFNCGYNKHRMDKPADIRYQVPDHFSVHHVIPITYMAFIWDYFHMDYPRLHPRIEFEFKQQAIVNVEQDTKQHLIDMDKSYKDNESELRAQYQRRHPDFSYHQITKIMRKEHRARKLDYQKNINKTTRIQREVQRLKNQYLLEVHGDILPTLDWLCFSDSMPNKSWFTWSFSNLFIGPDGDHREDDEQNGYIIEKRKPLSFSQDQWNALHSIFKWVTVLINIKRQQLQQRSPEVIKIELLLKSELRRLWHCASYLEEPLAYNEEDWQLIARDNYALR